MRQTDNENWYGNSALLQEAEGYQTDRAGQLRMMGDPNPDPARRNPNGVFARTGGLMVRRRLLLQEDQMFRFGARRFVDQGAPGLQPLLNSPWWMNDDRMFLLIDRARTQGIDLIEAARRQLALPLDWTQADIIVGVRMRPRILLAAHAGPGLTAESGEERRIIAPEAPHLFMDQIYLPGLGRHPALGGQGQANALAWFDPDTAKSYDPVRFTSPR